MENPEENMHTSKYITRPAIVEVFEEFGLKLNSFRVPGRVLEVGCGPGDITAEELLPRLPPTSSVVAMDITKSMIDHANTKFGSKRIEFKVVDFSLNDLADVLEEESFNMVFSSFCFHWIPDHKPVARNIFNLLKPGGEFLVVLLSPNHYVFHDQYTKLSEMSKWKHYMKSFKTDFFFSDDPCGDISRTWGAAGLQLLTCEERIAYGEFPSFETYFDLFEAANKYMVKMDKSIKQMYLDDAKDIIKNSKFLTKTDSGKGISENHILVVHGRRP